MCSLSHWSKHMSARSCVWHIASTHGCVDHDLLSRSCPPPVRGGNGDDDLGLSAHDNGMVTSTLGSSSNLSGGNANCIPGHARLWSRTMGLISCTQRQLHRVCQCTWQITLTKVAHLNCCSPKRSSKGKHYFHDFQPKNVRPKAVQDREGSSWYPAQGALSLKLIRFHPWLEEKYSKANNS